MSLLIGGIDINRLVGFLKTQPLMTEEEREELEADRSRLMGGGRTPNTVMSLDGKPFVRDIKTSFTSWEDVEKVRQAGGRLNLRMATSGGGPFSGRASAPAKDNKYVPLPAGLDKEWIDYIKQGKVPPLLGAAALVYPPPYFPEIGVFRNGKRRYDQMLCGVYECWFDTTDQDQVSQALIFMRKLNKVYLNFLRERVPGFENAYIVIESPSVAAREGRRIVGEYVLTEEDMLRGTSFPDVIARGGNRGPDAHSVTGIWGDGVHSTISRPFNIPFRCLVPKNIDNLLVAGRCMSTTHMAFGGSRNIAICMATGEAAGAAAAISIRSSVLPRNVEVKTLQRTLLKQGALLFLDDEKDQEKELYNGVPTNSKILQRG